MKPDRTLLKNVLGQPTAPFHEERVRNFVSEYCGSLGLRVQSDRLGNLKIVYRRGKSGKPIAFLAHMDHPGFEVTRGGKRPVVKLLGGVPDRFFSKARVTVIDGKNVLKGKVARLLSKKSRTWELLLKEEVSRKAFGYFDLAGCRFRGNAIESKSIDNLASVAILLNLLRELVRRKKRGHVVFYFTRAEEVGFVGLAGAIQNNLVSKTVPVVVLEASSAKAGKINLGEGPVLRVGDRLSTFSNSLDLEFHSVAQKIKKGDRSFRFQRALLPGGACEATLLAQNGFETICLAFPLANYHNAGSRSYACERIDQRDYANMLLWLWHLTGRKEVNARQALQKSLAKRFRSLRRRLI